MCYIVATCTPFNDDCCVRPLREKSLTEHNCKTCDFSFYELFYFHLQFHFHSSFFILAEAKARAKAQARRHISISVAGVFPLTWTKQTVGATKDPSVV